MAERPQAMPGRARASTAAASSNVVAPSSRFSAGTRTSRIVTSACHEARLAILPVIRRASKPGVPFSTT